MLFAVLLAALAARGAEPADVLGPWCAPGWPTCSFDVQESSVWIASTNRTRPWVMDGDVLVFDPGTLGAQRWRIHSTSDDFIKAEREGTGQITWFGRRATLTPAHLSAMYADVWADRATIAAGPLRWRARTDERWEAGELDAPEELVVADVRPDAVLLVGEWSGVRAATWIDLEALAPRLSHAVPLAPGITALPGASVNALLADGKHSIHIAEAGIEVGVSAPSRDIAIIYRPELRPHSTLWTLGPTTLYDASGEALLEVNPANLDWWIESASPDQPRAAVTLRTAHLRIEGAVDPSALIAGEEVVLSDTTIRRTLSAVPLAVPAGTLLRRSDEIVAVTTRATTLYVQPGSSPPELVAHLLLPWATTSVMVRCPGLDTTQSPWQCAPSPKQTAAPPAQP